MDTEIRQESPADYDAVFRVLRAAFGQDDEAMLVERLRSSAAFFPKLSLVAVSGGEVVGHILFTALKIRDENEKTYDSLALAPLAVLPSFQRAGIGSLLIRHGLEEARQLGHKSVIVLGHEHYYPKFGFLPAENWDIKAPFEVPPGVFMALELTGNGLQGIRGTVVYPPEFGIT